MSDIDKKASPEEFMRVCRNLGGAVFAPENCISDNSRKSMLLFTHDLSVTGAPIVLVRLAEELSSRGVVPVIISPKNGPLRQYLFQRE